MSHVLNSPKSLLALLLMACFAVPPALGEDDGAKPAAPATQPAAGSAPSVATVTQIPEVRDLLASFKPASVDEILSWYEPIPDFDELLARLDTAAPAVRQSLRPDLVQEMLDPIDEILVRGKFDESLAFARNLLKKARAERPADTCLIDRLTAVEQQQRSLGALPAAERKEILAHFREIGRYPDAEDVGDPIAEIAIVARGAATFRRLLGEESDLYNEAVANFAALLSMMEQASAADVATRELLRLLRARGQERCTNASIVLTKLETALVRQGRFAEALRVGRAGLACVCDLFGTRDLATSSVMGGVASTYIEAHQVDAGIELLDRALPITIAERANPFASIVDQLNTLANARAERSDWVGAIAMYEEALAALRARGGAQSRGYFVIMTNLAEALRAAGEYDAARERLDEIDTGLRRLYGAGYPGYGVVRGSQGTIDSLEGDVVAAKAKLREALAALRAERGGDSPDAVGTMLRLAQLELRAGEDDEAEQLLREVIAAELRSFGEDRTLVSPARADLAGLLLRSDDPDRQREGEELLRVAAEAARRTRGATGYRAMGQYGEFLLRKKHDPQSAAAWFRDCVAEIERMRTLNLGDEVARSRYSQILVGSRPFSGYARAALALEAATPAGGAASKPDADRAGLPRGAADAFSLLERGSGRALLDLLDRGAENSVAKAERRAQRRGDTERKHALAAAQRLWREAEFNRVSTEAAVRAGSQPGATSTPAAVSDSDAVAARDAETRTVHNLIRELVREFDNCGVAPRSAAELAATLQRGEIMLRYDVATDDTLLFVMRANGRVTAHPLQWPDGAPVAFAELNRAVARYLETNVGSVSRTGAPPASRPSDAAPGRTGAELGTALLPAELREELRSASRIFVIPDGPLCALPLEMLPISDAPQRQQLDVIPPITYSASGAVLVAKREAAAAHRATRTAALPATKDASAGKTVLVAVGDPAFGAMEDAEPPTPARGVLVMGTTPGSNAETHGIRVGDVLLAYDDAELDNVRDLARAIETGVKSTMDEHRLLIWRTGQSQQIGVAAGKLGVSISPLPLAAAMRSLRNSALDADARHGRRLRDAASTGFGGLTPLPGARVEVKALAAQAQRAGVPAERVRLLIGADASTAALAAAAEQPRFLHFATHALVDGGPRVLESALALATPRDANARDTGFLRLADLLSDWGGKLDGTELVVLSGCQTARGRFDAGEGFVGLTWGFLYAGADSVVASLWKVDDGATALLMNRLYENLLGNFDDARAGGAPHQAMQKAEALREAKLWLRGRTAAQNRAALRELGFLDAADENVVLRGPEGASPRLPTQPPATDADAFDYSAPRFWAAFVLVGDPD